MGRMNIDRVSGVLLGVAVGDALGVPYEYGSRPLPGPGEQARMLGGGLGGYAPGQWSDDTEMTSVIARVAARFTDLRDETALDAVAAGFLGWHAAGPADIGVQTSTVLGALRGIQESGAASRMRVQAAEVHVVTGRSAGNGSLMRTAPVALAHLGSPAAITRAARAVSSLTHHDPQAGEACALWSLAIDHAVRTGEIDARVGLDQVGPEWAGRLDEAEQAPPEKFSGANGWVVAALQGAWSAIVHTSGLVDGLQATVKAGGDTDTVAAIAGGLLGAGHGASAVPDEWRAAVHGWPGLRGDDLTALAMDIVHRHDPGSDH
ncbi:ADP-ribosylglycohydrolase family protein [Pseudonocardia sp. DSM 110487]|nr:ADP-ribosylglycohydrolase family protein [Pseudonocardia sp. DSM 110487]